MSIRVKGIIFYLLITFGMAWLLWEVAIRLLTSPRNPLFQLAALPGAFAPAVAAIIVRKWITREGFKDAGLRLKPFKWRYYLVAWLLPIPVIVCIIGLAVLLGISMPDFSLMRFASWIVPGAEIASPPPYIWVVIPFQFMFSAIVATPILWGEEFGWRGYLQIRIFESQPLRAAIITGIIWGVWHLPINLRGYNFPDHPVIGSFLFLVGTIFLSIIFGWLRERTGSIWAPSLAHAATNTIGGSLTLLLFIGGPNWIFVSYLGVLGLIPLGGFCAWLVFTHQLKPIHEVS
jgi:membrane protease YdiL (CAAX protease family)